MPEHHIPVDHAAPDHDRAYCMTCDNRGCGYFGVPNGTPEQVADSWVPTDPDRCRVHRHDTRPAPRRGGWTYGDHPGLNPGWRLDGTNLVLDRDPGEGYLLWIDGRPGDLIDRFLDPAMRYVEKHFESRSDPDHGPDRIAEVALDAIDQYEREREALRKTLSIEQWGHPGAHVSEAWPTREGRKAAIVAALDRRPDPQVRPPTPPPGDCLDCYAGEGVCVACPAGQE